MPFKIFEQLFKRPPLDGKDTYADISQEKTTNNKEGLRGDDKKLIEILRRTCQEPIFGAKNMPIRFFEEIKKMFKTTDLRVVTESEMYKEILKKGFILGSGEERIYYGQKPGRISEDEQTNIHLGIDYMVEEGTAVSAIDNGEIINIETTDKNKQKLSEDYDQGLYRGEGGYGNMVVLQHKLDNGEIIYSLYGHLASPEKPLKIGDRVKRGDIIGAVGKSFSIENGGWPSHLHFNILKEKTAIAGYGSVEELKKTIDPLKIFH